MRNTLIFRTNKLRSSLVVNMTIDNEPYTGILINKGADLVKEFKIINKIFQDNNYFRDVQEIKMKGDSNEGE